MNSHMPLETEPLKDLEKLRRRLELRNAIFEDPIGNQAMNLGSTLNSKTAALLAHVSIMIVVSTTALNSIGNINLKFALAFVTIAYLIISILCLYVIRLNIENLSKNAEKQNIEIDIIKEEVVTRVIKEISLRRFIYIWALRSTIAITIASVITSIFYALSSH